MATALQHITEYCVCTNEFTDPRVLPCDHTFCQTCIDHIKKSSKIKCPVCNEIHDVNRIKPDFKLTQFIDALKEKERTHGLRAGEGAVCDLCSDESAIHWCEECKQWLGKTCTQMHSKIPAVQNHKLLPISIKCQQVKSEFTKEARRIKEVMDHYLRSIRDIQDHVDKLEITQANALENSDELRNKAIQDIHNVFNAVDAKIIAFIHANTQRLDIKRTELAKELDGIEAKWNQLETMRNENSIKIAIEGPVIVDQARRFKKVISKLDIRMGPVYVIVSSGIDWNPETVVKAQLIGGNITATNTTLARTAISETITESSSLDLSRLYMKTFESKNHTRLNNKTSALRLINNQLWVCEDYGVIQVFDMSFKQIKNIKNRAWGHVWDVVWMSNGGLVVAARNGLYHARLDGRQICRIQSGFYISAVVYNSKLYTSQYNSDKVNIYLYNETWKREGSVQLPCSGTSTLDVNQNVIVACHGDGNKVYKLSHTGQGLQSFGSSGSGPPGDLKFPFLCQADNDGRFLVSDFINDRLQMLDKDSTWGVVRMHPPVMKPIGAVYAGGKLYVVSNAKHFLHEYVSK